MSKIDLHIISFNIPYPANYGGIIDVFYKLKHLSEAGLNIHLHCFQYGREKQEILNQFATKVSYYPRPKSFLYHLSIKPYIVRSRQNKNLLNNLLQDEAPIIFEGLHTCAFLNHNNLKKRLKIVRTHNIEHNYYHELSNRTSNVFKKAYYILDAIKLKYFEKVLQSADTLISISQNDFYYFNTKYGKTTLIPPFHQSNVCEIKTGKGDYALFHGNLSVAENYQMVVWIIENLLSNINIPLKIAGNNPDKSIFQAITNYSHITLISNPSDDELKNLISNAQLNLLFTLQSTGLKLKLLNALFNGRFCICNDKMLEGTGISNSVNIVNLENQSNCISQIETIFNQTFTQADIQTRIDEVSVLYDNKKNVELLLGVIQK